MYNLPMDTAGYRVIEDIRDYNKLGGMKKELSNTCMQVCMINQISARQNKAIMALVKLHSHGIREDDYCVKNQCLD